MTTFVVAHGAWGAGWFWKKMHPLMRERGHQLITPTLTGLGERHHLAHADVDLETHLQDLLNVLHFEDLRDIVLVGHSYGGMVATGVADRASERIRQLVYVDAFVPRDGQSALSLMSSAAQQILLDKVAAQGDGWRVPANPMPPDSDPADIAWATPRRMLQPLKTFTQPLTLTGKVDTLPRTYLYCKVSGPGDVFAQFAQRARSQAGWQCFDLDTSHNPHVTTPVHLADLLDQIQARR